MPAAQVVSVTVHHACFHVVIRAYNILHGKLLPFADDNVLSLHSRDTHQQAYQWHTVADFMEAAGVRRAGEAWKDQVIIIFGLTVCTPYFSLSSI